MKKLFILSILLLNLPIQILLGQPSCKFDAGIGAGLDYGGFGGQLSFLPVKITSFFAAAGYNRNSLDYNFGAKLKFRTEKRISWHLTAMYGYNTVLSVEGDHESKITYYGPTAGAGVEFKLHETGKSFLSVEILVPFRPDAYDKATEDLKNMGYKIKELIPVSFSIGYHFMFLKF